MSIMWHEARRQERKIRGMLVDYRRRAERRRDFYERIKADPTQFLQVHGRRCKIHLDPGVAAAADSAVMMPWQGQADVLIDRFDVRAHLDYIPPIGKLEEEELTQEDRQINYERYRIIAQNSFLGLSEEKFLKQLHLEEQYGYTEMKTKKESRTGGAAIGFNYEDGIGVTESPLPDNDEDSDENDSDSDLDVDLAINVSKMEPAQAHEMNKHGRSYGMSSNDFYSFLTNDLEEAEAVRLAREEEQEKALFSGRKSRRERRYHREKRLANRVISPPSYAAKASPTLPNLRDSKSKSHSRSPSPENSGKITYITSFGDDEDVPSSSKPTYADKVKYGIPKSRTIQISERGVHSERKNKSRSRERSYGSKRKRSRSGSRSKSKTSGGRGMTRKSRSRSRTRRSLSKSRSRKSRSRSRTRRSLSRSKRSRSWSRNRKSRSRSKNRRSRSRSKIRRNRSRTRSNKSRSRSSSRSRSRKSRSRSRDRMRRSHSQPRAKSFRRRHSTSSSSSASSRSRSRSLSGQQNRETVTLPTNDSPEKTTPNAPESLKVIPRYYGRRKSDQSSSELSDSDDQVDVDMKPAHNTVSAESKSGHGNSSGSAIKKNSASMTVIERLKRKRQALLNRQFKADKVAEQLKTEREKLEQQTREDELREMAIKLRRRQREIRHANDSRSSSSDSDATNKTKDSEEPKPKTRSTSREREESKKRESVRDCKDKDYQEERSNRKGKDRRDSRDNKEHRSKEIRDVGRDNQSRDRRGETREVWDTRRDRWDRRSPSPRRGYRENWRGEREKEGDRGSRLVDY